MRVTQLDAAQLDSELNGMLIGRFFGLFTFLQPPNNNNNNGGVRRWRPELEALLQLLIYRFTTFVGKPSPGNQLQNLEYHGARLSTAAVRPPRGLSRLQRLAFPLGFIGVRYVWTRWRQHVVEAGGAVAPDDDEDDAVAGAADGGRSRFSAAWRRWLARWTQRVETTYRAAHMLNFVAFLWNGRYRSLLERVLRMRLGYAQPRAAAQISFEFMNQQLVWQAFSDFMLFLLPLVNFGWIRQLLVRLYRVVRPLKKPSAAEVAAAAATAGSCAKCDANPITSPFRAVPCGHTFCYYCLSASRLAAEQADAARGFKCPTCGVRVTAHVAAVVTTTTATVLPAESKLQQPQQQEEAKA
jgi:peroxin-2